MIYTLDNPMNSRKFKNFFKVKNLFVLWFAGLLPAWLQAQSNFVNPLVGTDGHGHTFPGAVLPFGMIQMSPDTRIDGSWDGCSGYHYSDSLIYGFSQTHLSGTGVSDYGDFLLMPSSGTWSLDPLRYRSAFSHQHEKASAGYYAVELGNGVDVEMIAGLRAGMHRYQFPKGQSSYLLLDLQHRDRLLEGRVEKVDAYRWKMMRRSDAWARDQHCYGFLEFSSPATVVMDSAACKLVWSFDCPNGELWVKIAISGVDQEGARLNMVSELQVGQSDKEATKDRAKKATKDRAKDRTKEFIQVWKRLKASATQTWNQALGVIEIEDPDTARIRTFYTALYRCMIHPSLASDADGRYRGRDGLIHRAEGFDYYTVFSLWDTYRALHPLWTWLDPKRTRDFVMTFLEQYKQVGRLPVWEFASNETNCMIGYHSVSVIADAMVKGIQGFDRKLALEAMQHSANQDYEGIAYLRDHGHLNVEACSESVSKQLEYAYDDWCIAQAALATGDSLLYRNYLQRSGSWRNILDSASGMMRPRVNGQWLSPFDPKEVNNHYTEANAWQTSFYVPQDVYGWVDAVGGPVRAEALLDTLFLTQSKTVGREQADITGLIGQYAHGNEPSHHIAYLYHYLGKPAKTLAEVRRIQDEFYSDRPDGLIGNEDCGQMSAWYVLSSLGLYPLAPGSTEWIWSVPSLAKVTVHLPQASNHLHQSKKLILNTSAPYRRGTAWPQRFWNKARQPHALSIDHRQLMEGGVWDIGSEGEMAAGAGLSEIPFQLPALQDRSKNFRSVPLIEASSARFGDSLRVSIRSDRSSTGIRYALGSADPVKNGLPYTGPLTLYRSDTVSALAIDAEGRPGFVVTARYSRIDPKLKVSLTYPYNRQYHAGGPLALVDGIEGDGAWRKGHWHGYQGNPFEAVLELPKATMVDSIDAGFLQDVRSWIVLPAKVGFWAKKSSTDDWVFLGEISHQQSVTNLEVFRQPLGIRCAAPGPWSHLKVNALQYGALPAWHPGAG
ncbi:MAG: GH92 family glycosyl hydrolase, partial [Bacteroidota bacterium]